MWFDKWTLLVNTYTDGDCFHFCDSVCWSSLAELEKEGQYNKDEHYYVAVYARGCRRDHVVNLRNSFRHDCLVLFKAFLDINQESLFIDHVFLYSLGTFFYWCGRTWQLSNLFILFLLHLILQNWAHHRSPSLTHICLYYQINKLNYYKTFN